MLKEVVIYVLGSMVLSQHPWLQTDDMGEKIVIIVGLAIVLFIFLLFLEETVQKVKRVRKMKQMLRQIAGIKIGEKR